MVRGTRSVRYDGAMVTLPADFDSTMGSLEPSYWARSKAPLPSLLLVAPLLVVYEVGVLFLGPQAARNGADVWLRQMLASIGLGEYLLLPGATVGVLLSMHFASPRKLGATPGLLWRMAAESIALALLLVLMARLQQRLLAIPASVADMPCLAWLAPRQAGLFERLVGYAGAGIYEELLFRLLLLTFLARLIRLGKATEERALVVSAVVTSLLFSAAHYVGPLGDHWTLSSFVFRFVAGGFFATLFVLRGFGIVACTHAIYDVLVGILLL